MPLIKSGSRKALQTNIREMVRSGHKPKVAIAASLANQRKHLAEGGEVDGDHDEREDMGLGSVDSASDEGLAGEAVYPEGMDDEGLSANVMDAERLAEGLQARRMKANDNHNSFNPDDMVAGQKMNKGGQVQSEQGQALGNIPELNWEDDGNGEPMSVQAGSKGQPGSLEHRPMRDEAGAVLPSGLSEEAKRAIAKKKAGRKIFHYDPK